MVKASSGNPLLAVHAVRTRGGGLNVMLINKDPANPVTASLSYSGFTPASRRRRARSPRCPTSRAAPD
ncbi:MAG: hypothetical protein ACJ786_18340 [Catenulispora sp.]